MPNLLLKLVGSSTFNRTIFPPHLFLYDDVMIYRKRGFFKVREVTIAYSHIVQVNLVRGIFFARLEIVNTGVDNIIVKYVSKAQAAKAKRVIDQKIYYSHAKEKSDQEMTPVNVHNFEKSLNRLKELVNKGLITQREYNIRREKYLKHIR